MNGPIEPSADLRVFATFIRQMFLALVGEEFTEQQALAILGHVIAATVNKGDG